MNHALLWCNEPAPKYKYNIVIPKTEWIYPGNGQSSYQQTTNETHGFNYKVDFNFRLFESVNNQGNILSNKIYSGLCPQQGINYVGRKYYTELTYEYVTDLNSFPSENLIVFQPVGSWSASSTIYNRWSWDNKHGRPQIRCYVKDVTNKILQNWVGTGADDFLWMPSRSANSSGGWYYNQLKGEVKSFGKMVNPYPIWIARLFDGEGTSVPKGKSVTINIKGTMYYE